MTNFKYLQKMFFLLVMGFSLSFVCVACGDDEEDEPGTDPSKDTTDIAVTGKVDKYGCTYADISGYANLNQLPAGSGNPEIGIEIREAGSEGDYLDRETTASLMGNIFTVEFDSLYPSTEYEYRSFVEYGGLTHYGEYRTFTTKQAYNVTSTGAASDVTYRSATITSGVKLSSIDERDDIRVGVAYSTSKTALHRDSVFSSQTTYVSDDEDEFVVTLSGLSDNTTYYYASFTLLEGEYVLSDVKNFKTEDDLETSEAVDLGLSVKWAAYNVGASSPEEYGDYFAWGETATKSSYDSDNSTTYGLSYSELQSRGIIGSDGNLTAAYDAATANWGSAWRMPTFDEMKELLNECTWEWITYKDVEGRLVTGPNGNSIFLPAAGGRYGSYLYFAGSRGGYWSATPYSDSYFACRLLFVSGSYNWTTDDRNRYLGHAVRPVSE